VAPSLGRGPKVEGKVADLTFGLFIFKNNDTPWRDLFLGWGIVINILREWIACVNSSEEVVDNYRWCGRFWEGQERDDIYGIASFSSSLKRLATALLVSSVSFFSVGSIKDNLGRIPGVIENSILLFFDRECCDADRAVSVILQIWSISFFGRLFFFIQ